LELLKEAVPKLDRVAVLWNAADPGMAARFREIGNVQRLSRDLLLHVRKEARCRELADERLFGRLCHDARPVAKKVELHTMSTEFTAVSLLLLVEGLPAGRQRLVPCLSNLDDQRCHCGTRLQPNLSAAATPWTRSQVRSGLAAGGRWIRTSGSGASGEADAILPVKDRPR
jgi:hypothetical protein